MLANASSFPKLNTDFSASLDFLEKKFLTQRKLICEWFESQWKLTQPPVYGSIDLRNAGFKLAPVDMNLFPAGFNNLNPEFLSFAAIAAKKVITQIVPNAKRILILPESHTRNIYYWKSAKALQNILQTAGFDVQFGVLDVATLTNEILKNEKEIIIGPLLRKQNKLYVENFCPDMILLNNDLSEGIPEILQNLDQPLYPPAELGWNQRLKSEHFQYYAKVVEEFSAQIQIDPWLIAPLFRHCGEIDFMQQGGIECLISNAEILFAEIKKKYAEYNIPYQPFLVIKADAGTYGMAVMTIRNIDELRSLNRKQRTSMSKTKGGQPVHRVIIQEGVYTFETVGNDQAVAEPVVYLWGDCVIGGFYRVHKERGTDENLNAPGMQFEPIAFSRICHEPCEETKPDAMQNRFYIYGMIAQLSMLAAAREIKDQVQK